MANRIVLKDVDAGYGAVRVLHRVCLEVREGETVVLLGTNGNGKSTVMKCLMGLVQADAGEVFWETNGQRIVVLDAGQIIAAGTPDEIVHNHAVEKAYLGE